MISTIPKPIFVIGVPVANLETTEEVIDSMRRTHDAAAYLMTDYHIVVHPIDATEMKFQAFYAKDFSETKYEELKAEILEATKQASSLT